MDVLSTGFRKQLELTQHWCKNRIDPSDPANCLRSSDLRPQLEIFRYRDDDIWIVPELVEQVIQRRQSYFSPSVESVSVPHIDQHRCRLLLAAQDYSNHNGQTSDLTDGFFDLNDVPPWDTWIELIQGERQGMSLSIWGGEWPPTMNSHFGYPDLMCGILVSWVPKEFELIVDHAIKAEAMGMLAWADDLPHEGDSCINFRRVLPRWFQNFMKGFRAKSDNLPV